MCHMLKNLQSCQGEDNDEITRDDLRQIVSEVHHQRIYNHDRTAFVQLGYDSVWEIDLLDFHKLTSYNNKKRYVLVVIDTWSKFLFTRGLNLKNAESVTFAMNDIILQSGRCPRKIHADAGKEFWNSKFKEMLKKYGIEM